MIHPTIWPQYTNITDRQDNGSVAYGEPLLVTVAPKLNITFCDLMFALFFVVTSIVTVGVTQSLVSLQFGDDVRKCISSTDESG